MTEELPEGWAWTTLGEVSESVKNGIYVSRARSEPDGVPILRIGAVRSLSLDLGDLRYSRISEQKLRNRGALLEPGDLLFTRYNGNADLVGACAVVPDVAALTYPDKLIRVRISEGLALPEYVALIVASPKTRQQFKRRVRSTAGQAGISGAGLKSVPIPLPPMAEQRRIVDALEGYLSGLESAGDIVENSKLRLRRLRSNYIRSHVFGRKEGEKEADRLDSVGVDDGPMVGLPEGWRWRRLHEVADVVSGVAKGSKEKDGSELVEVPYLRVANVQKGYLDLSSVKNIRVSQRKIEQLKLRHSDVLLNEGGDRDKLGRGWVWENQISGCIHQNHVFRARMKGREVHPKFLAWYANEAATHWFYANAKQSVNLASISLSTINLLPVPVPPRGEQESIVRRISEGLESFTRVENQLESIQVKATALRRALLAAAFSGKLVPQDPTDDSASVCLERIRAERASSPKAKRARRDEPGKRPVRPPDHPQPVPAGEQTALEF